MKIRKIGICLVLTACCSLLGSGFTINAANATTTPPETVMPGENISSGAEGTASPEESRTSGSQRTANPGESWPAAPELLGDYAVLMEANSGTVLYSRNGDEKNYPASTTKILTALIAIENSQMDEKVTFSYDSVHKTEGSGIWRDVDEVMTMEECLYALLLNSANECAYAIAEHVGGTYENFVKMMNERAKAIGCKNTNFANPHGLTEEGHYTSCYDMALIAAEAIKNETFREITGTRRYDIPPTNKHPDEITYLRNHHKMLFEGEEYYYESCIGGKTGYTMAAKNTLVTYAEKDGMLLVCVVMREEPTNHYQDTRTLLNYGFDNFSAYNISEHMPKDSGSGTKESDFFAPPSFADIDENAIIVLPAEAQFSDADMEVLYENVGKTTAGTLQYTYGGQVVGTADIELTKVPVEEYPFEQQEDNQPEKEVIRINVPLILLSILGVAALAAAAVGVYKLKDNFYLLRYRLRSRRKRDLREIVIKKKRRRRRR